MAMPTGQVFRWHFRIITQPMAINGAVAKPYSSAPRQAATITSRPVLSWPSVCSRTRPAQAIANQGLLRLGQAELPGNTRVADARERRGAGAPAITADEYPVGVSLGNTRGNGPHARGGDQLDRNLGVRIGVLEIKNQLRQVLDRIDIVVGRRRDQADARRAVTRLGDEVVNFVAGKLAPFARLGPLGHLDLDLDGVRQIIGGHAEAAAGNLLDRAVARVAVGVASETGGVLAPFSRVASSADPVHGDGQRLMGLLADAAEAHGAGAEALDDLRGRLDNLQGNRFAAGLDLQQPAQGAKLPALVIAGGGELLVAGALFFLSGVLQLLDGLGVPHVMLAPAAPHDFTAGVELRQLGTGGERVRQLRPAEATRGQ